MEIKTLREGQTQVSFALDSDSASAGAGEPANANDPLEGDYLVKTETYTSDTPLRRTTPWGTLTTEDDPNTPSVIVLSEGQLRYVQDASGNLTKGSEDPAIRTTYDADGNPNGTEEIPSDDETITDNTLFGSANKDKIDGKSGADLIDGKGGNDQIDGGSGDDMIGGGAGSDNIKGGDGNDYISSSANIQNTRQQVSATDTWNRWGLPDGETAITQGAMWGTYLSQQTPEFKVTVWSGITDTSTDASDTEGDVIDGGAGNRHLAWFRRRAAGRFDGFAHTTPGKTLNGMSKLD